VFCAAILNSQPMGFYQPAQIIADAQEHAVPVLPIDVNLSGWDCSVEVVPAGARDAPPWLGTSPSFPRPPLSDRMYGEGGPAIRLGMRLVSGLGEEAGRAIEQAVVRFGHFRSIQSLWRASGVRVKDLRRLAAADAFNSMGLERRAALWAIRALRDDRLSLFDQPGKRAAEMDEAPPALPILTLPAKVLRDYQVTGFSLKDHPMRPYRETLNGAGVAPMKDLRDPALAPHGRRIKVAGLVLLRQRPGTASGIVFMTMEDETGTANLIVRPQVYERYRRVARHSNSLVITGTVERAGEVVHIMVRRIELLADAARGNELPVVQSRDFH